MKKSLLAILSVVFFANQASANFHSGTEEENERLSRLIMQYGEIIHSVPMKDAKGNELSAIYHVRVNKGSSNRMKLQPIPEGIYVCFVAITTVEVVEGKESLFNCLPL